MAHVQNFELDILFVRTNDIVEFVADGVAELGITGLDLVAESEADVVQLRRLGYGRCRLTVAVPNDSPYQSVEELEGLRVATTHKSLTRRFFEERGIPVDVVPLSGAVEVVAAARSRRRRSWTWSRPARRMVVNGLRPIEEVFASEAVLLAGNAAAAITPRRSNRSR